MSDTYDFIIVGGGTSGPVLARRLADTPSAPRVLLLESGGPNDDESFRSPETRFALPFIAPAMKYGYESIPQAHLNGQQIAADRGRGLGGSSAINFSCWLLGHKEDFNEWADIVGDDIWKWEGENGVKQRFRKIENVHDELDDTQAKYVSRDAMKEHSKEGKVDLSFGQQWAPVDTLAIDAGLEFGMKINGDLNSGDPTGWGLGPTTYFKGLRVTGATAYLSSPPDNLTILTNTPVAKVIFDDTKRAVGVRTTLGQAYHAAKEIIISAGAIDSPKILLLSGVGPATELTNFSIPVIHDLPGVGKNMKDHCLVTTTFLLKPKESLRTPEAVTILDPLRDVGSQVPMAWLQSPAVYASSEFAALDKATQEHLVKVPSFEFIAVNTNMAQVALPRSDAEVLTLLVVVMNSLSTGSVKLASSHPSDAPIIDTNDLSHPYDCRVVIEALRTIREYSKVPSIANVTEKLIEGPASYEGDDHILEHAKRAVKSAWHYGGTCRMGKEGDAMSVVDSGFRVRGVTGLRVVDHGVAPLMVNNHTQSTAYLIGETAAEKMIAEYGL